MTSPLPVIESARLETLLRYEILDTARNQVFDDLARLATTICGTPMGLIGFVGADRQWFKSRIGAPFNEVAREHSFCAHTILQDGLLLVKDTLADERFATYPQVTADPFIRFYAGAPLIAPNGHAIGAVCVMDREPRELQPEQTEALLVLSRQIVDQLELRRHAATLPGALAGRVHEQQRESIYRELLEQAPDGIHSYDLQGNFIEVNSKLAEMLGYTRSELLRLNVRDLIPEEDLATAPIRFAELVAGKVLLTERRLRRKDGRLIEVEISGKIGETGHLHAVVRDITKRKQIEAALLRSEARYRIVTETASDVILTVDDTSTILFANHSVERVFGYTADELTGAPLTMLIPEYLRGLHEAGMSRYIATGESHLDWQLVEVTGLRKNGMEVPLEISLGAFIENGRHCFTGIIRDVSERKRASDALRESEEQFRQLAESISGVFWLRQVGKRELVYVSPSYEQVWGRSREDLYAAPNSWLDAVHPEDRERIREASRTKQQQGDYDEEYRIIRPDGSEHWIQDRAFPIKNAEGQVYRIAGVAADITTRRLDEEALRQSEERFFKAFNASPAPKTISRLTDSNFLFVNNSFLQASGYTSEEVIGRNTMDLKLWADLQQRELFFRALQETGQVNRLEVKLRSKSGELRTCLLSAQVIEMSGERCILTLTIDITERILAQRRLAAQYAVTLVLAEAATLTEASPQILQAICRNLDWSLGALWFVHGAEEALRCVEIWHDPAVTAPEFVEISREARYERQTGFPSHVWASGEPLWVPDFAADERSPRASIAAQEGLHGAVGFPIRLGQEVLGVMEFFSHEIRPFDEDVINVMTTIGSQIGQYAARKRAEEELRKTNAELEERVLKRTAELAAANLVLEEEVIVRTRSEEARAQLLRSLVGAQEEERRRIAREMHDKTGQYLSLITLGLNSLKDDSQAQPATHARLERLLLITGELAKEIHHLAWELRPAVLDDVGLQPALATYLAKWSERAGVLVDFHTNNLDQQRLAPEIETTIYRVVQEALTNVMKHAQSRRVSVLIEARPNKLQLIVEDDGKGFVTDCLLRGSNPQERLGLIGMRERVAMLAGTFEIESAPDCGTTIFIRIPISMAARGVGAHE